MSDHSTKMRGPNNENDVLQNYFSYTIIPQLYLNGNLILRKLTPPAM